MATFNTPENYPDIYWLGLGDYEEKTEAFQTEYGFSPQENQTTEELVAEVESTGHAVPPKPVTDFCSFTAEEKRALMAALLEQLTNNDCDECKQKINEQIMALLKCGQGGENG